VERLAVSISFKCTETVAFLFRLLLFGETHCSGFGFLSSVVFVETAYIFKSGFFECNVLISLLVVIFDHHVASGIKI
jgi:hypothetical protein